MLTQEDTQIMRSGIYRTIPKVEPLESRQKLLDASQNLPFYLMDLSLSKRSGVRGKQAEQYLSKKIKDITENPDQDNTLPERPNEVSALTNNRLVFRLSNTEYWLLQPFDAADLSVETGASFPDQCYPLFCQYSHAWFILAGSARAELMAKLCSVDLSAKAFPTNSIAQTSVAKTNATIASHSFGEASVFSILCDSSVAEYLWEAINEAGKEFL